MFAGAVRETVYSRPDVIARMATEFVPVAVKAALINNPPRGLEGAYLAEVGRTKAAPQGIVAANGAGKILVWALSFDSRDEVPKFLDYVLERNLLYPDASVPVATKRFLRFPSEPMADVADTGAPLPPVRPHGGGADYCPGVPPKPKGTFVVRVAGRRVADDGALCGDCEKQENYIEDVFDVSPHLQRLVARAVGGPADGGASATGTPTRLPEAFVRLLATYCYLGMLDVRPVAPPVPGHRATAKTLELIAEPAGTGEGGSRRFRLRGATDVHASSGGRGGDGAAYAHTVTLRWQGWLTVQGERITGLTVMGQGREQLRWGSPMFEAMAGRDPATHLMAGRPLNVDSPVRYGVVGAPASDAVTWQGDGPVPDLGRRAGPPDSLRRKMGRFQAAVARWRRAGHSLADVQLQMQRFQGYTRSRDWAKAERVLDAVLTIVEAK